MFERKLFTRDQIVAFLDRRTQEDYWRTLVKDYPVVYRVLWDTLPARLCQDQARYRHWDNTEVYLRIRDALTVLYWSLGNDVATELLYIGKVPVLIALLDLRDNVEKQTLSHVDLQTHLILTTVKTIACFHNNKDKDFATIDTLNDLSIGDSYRDLLVESYVRVEVSQQSLLKEKIDVIVDGRRSDRSAMGRCQFKK